MSILSAHLEQISVSCSGIDSLPFPPPRIFSNALLANPDITSLIRDTEAHERALFSVPPPPPPTASSQSLDAQPTASARRQTVFNVAGGEVSTGPPSSSARGGPRRNTAVAAVLGAPLHAQLQSRSAVATGADQAGHGAARGDFDVEVLLHGAEKLCTVYALPGAAERIAQQRNKYSHQSNTLAYYEAKVNDQAQALERRTREHQREDDDDNDDDEDDNGKKPSSGRADGNSANDLTEEDLRREEEEVRELDKKKKELQERLRATEKDLGGLLNL